VKEFALASVLLLGCAQDPAVPFAVHEWGTFTSVSGSDGTPTVWRPLAAADDLPTFVYRDGGVRGVPAALLQKNVLPTRVRMETPVIYFYSDRERSVSARVDFSKGRITEWYPVAVPGKQGIDWGRFTVLAAGADATLPREAADSHYYPARETDASLVRVRDREEEQVEKFLFYRGVGTFDLPIRTSLDRGRVTVEKVGGDPLPQAILFENSGGKIGYRILGTVRDRITAERPELSGDVDAVLAVLERSLTDAGLFDKEARAMLQTWRDSWFEEGLRVLYLVPRPATDSILPLTVEPRPNSVVRVLVGRAELITAEQEERLIGLVRDLSSPTTAIREAARTRIAKLGRFADPALRLILRTTADPALQTRIRELISG
jgi:hypothetical protein